MNTKINQKKVFIAAIVVIFLMFLFGLSQHILANKLLFTGEMIPIDPNVLATFPMEIGMWTGQEVPLDEAIIEATDTDARISRSYSRNNGLESVSLYVAFGQRSRDLMPHRPEVCYIGAGWTQAANQSDELQLEDGTKLPCTIMQFTRGALGQSKVMILDYYIVDGEFSRDVSLLRSKIWRGSGAIKYTAQIQISMPVSAGQNTDSVKEVISEFAIESSLLLKKLLATFNKKETEPNQNTDSNSVFEETESD